MKLETYSWRCTGLSGLLQNNPASIVGSPTPEGKKKKKSHTSAGTKYIPEEEAEEKCVRDKTGFYIEPQAFRNGIIYACIGKKIKGRSMKAIITPSVFFTDGERCYLKHPDTGKLLDKYEIDTRRAVIQGKAIMRSRPLFKEWMCDVNFNIDMDNITEIEVIDELFSQAGYTSGVGDFRPQKGGWFGRYEVKRIS